MYVKVLILVFVIKLGDSSVIIPEELPSLLSVVYSNIPPIKKGTDSRIGFGYAFGNHGDFQITLELGPQTNTNPIGQTFPSNTKRQASNPPKNNKNRDKVVQSAEQYLANWAQNMRNPDKNPELNPELSEELKPGEVPNLEDSLVELVQNDKGQYEIHQPAPKYIPAQVINQLRKLYGRNPENDQTKLDRLQSPKKGDLKDNFEKLSQYNVRERSKEEIKKITEDLSNVDLD